MKKEATGSANIYAMEKREDVAGWNNKALLIKKNVRYRPKRNNKPKPVGY